MSPMLFNMNKFYVFFLFLSFNICVQAQQTISVEGNIIDKSSKLPLDFVSIQESDSTKTLNQVESDALGNFTLGSFKIGNTIIFNLLGYDELRIQTNAGTPANLGIIELITSANKLQEIDITTQKNAVELRFEKKIFNVDKDLSAVGGTALDAIKSIPGTSVDMDGNVSLRGSSNIRVMVNGINSTTTGNDRQNVFDQIPSSLIERIEVINNPGANSDSEGNAGIINIVLKKNTESGINSKIGYTYGLRDIHEFNGSLGLRLGKISNYLSVNYRYSDLWRTQNQERTSTIGDTTFIFNNDNNGSNQRNGLNIRLASDYIPTPNDLISFAFVINPNQSTGENYGNFRFYDKPEQLSFLSRKITKESGFSEIYEGSIAWNHKWKNQEFTLLSQYSSSFNKTNQLVLDNYFNGQNLEFQTPDFQRNNRELDRNFFVLQADYVKPKIIGNFKLETGAKLTFDLNNNSNVLDTLDIASNLWRDYAGISNQFEFNEKVFAGYLTTSTEHKKWKYSAGIRTEIVAMDVIQKTSNKTVNQRYWQLFPSASISYKASAVNQFQASYSRRINRPKFESINPFIEYTDQWNLRYGNPNLNPEFAHSFETGYLRYFPNGSALFSAFGRYNENLITRFTFVDSLGIRNLTWTNNNYSTEIGIEGSSNIELNKNWKVSGGLSYYITTVQLDNSIASSTNQGDVLTGRLALNGTFYKNIDAQLTWNYRSRFVTALGSSDPFTSTDLSFRKPFLKNRLNVIFRISDLFDTSRFGFNINQPDFNFNLDSKRRTRNYFIGFTMNLNPPKGKTSKSLLDDKPKFNENTDMGG